MNVAMNKSGYDSIETSWNGAPSLFPGFEAAANESDAVMLDVR